MLRTAGRLRCRRARGAANGAERHHRWGRRAREGRDTTIVGQIFVSQIFVCQFWGKTNKQNLTKPNLTLPKITLSNLCYPWLTPIKQFFEKFQWTKICPDEHLSGYRGIHPSDVQVRVEFKGRFFFLLSSPLESNEKKRWETAVFVKLNKYTYLIPTMVPISIMWHSTFGILICLSKSYDSFVAHAWQNRSKQLFAAN